MFQFKRTLVTRGYEMDARRYVSPATMARYQEHVRWHAVSAPEFGLMGLISRGFKTVIRAQQIDLGDPIMQDVELSLSMSIAHVGRTSVRFAHRIVRASDQREVAAAMATAVLLDSKNTPTELPERVRALVQPSAALQTGPVDAQAPEQAWSRHVQVRPSDLDILQHVNQSRYVEFCDDTRQLAARAQAYAAGSTRAAGRVVGVAIEYLRETVVGHDLLCRTWAIDADGGRLGFELADAEDGGLVARARLDVTED